MRKERGQGGEETGRTPKKGIGPAQCHLWVMESTRGITGSPERARQCSLHQTRRDLGVSE